MSAETPSPTDRPGERYDYRDIPLELLDEPSIAIRETMDEVELAAGALNVMRIGLINPLTVFAKPDGRYEVIAGHRRLLECRIAKYTPVPCAIKLGDHIDPLDILLSENEHREEVNPVHQGRFYERVLELRAGNDVDKLCEIVKRRREHVEDRLLLVRQHPRLVQAVEQRKISLAVARELSKVTDDARLMVLLDAAIQGGATARLVAQWVRDGAELGDIQIAPPNGSTSTSSADASGFQFRMECMFCEDSDFPELMEILYIHKTCHKMLDRLLHRAPADVAGSGD